MTNTPYIDWFRKEYVGENGYVDCHGEVLLDDITKTIESERERVIGEMVKLNDKELHCGWKHDISQDSIERKLCNECYAINEFINKLKKKG